jgi:hypothetical protein
VPPEDLIQTGICDKTSGLTKITTHMDHMGHRRAELVQIGRMNVLTKYLSYILAGMRSGMPCLAKTIEVWSTVISLWCDLIAASTGDEYSVGPSIGPKSTK